MKLQTIERNIENNGILSEANFGISDADQAHVLAILRDKLYSDKFMAIVREYSTNAWDAHQEAGIGTTPIKITAPTKFEPTLSIRDYGFGLTQEQIYNVYCRYGRSTKRDSNDVVGQLGLGSKSGFAYTNSFSIVSHCYGYKTTYTAYIDESGVGKVSELGRSPSDETGIEILIPIKQADVGAVQERIKRIAPYFTPVPICNIEVPTPEYVVTARANERWWGVRREYLNGPQAIMGNIPYTIDIHRLPELTEDDKELLECGIDITFNIGELSIAASREALEYTDSTRKAIYSRLTEVRKSIAGSLSERFDSINSVWEARQTYYNTVTTQVRSSGRYNARNIIATITQQKFANFRGVDLRVSQIQFQRVPESGISCKYLPHLGKKPLDGTTYTSRRIDLFPNLEIIINDVSSAWFKRLLAYRDSQPETNPKTGYLIFTKEADTITDAEVETKVNNYLSRSGLTGITITKISSMPATEKTTRGPRDPNAPVTVTDSIARAKVFSLLPNYSKTTHPLSKNWAPAEIDIEEDEGVYMVIHGFTAETRMEMDQLAALVSLGFDVTQTPIYGIRRELDGKMGPGWVNYKDWVAPKLQELLNSSTERSKFLASYISSKYSLHWSFSEKYLKEAQFKQRCQDPEVVTAFEQISQAAIIISGVPWIERESIQRVTSALESDIMVAVSPSVKLIENVLTRYPMLQASGIFNGYSLGNSQKAVQTLNALADYINLVQS